MFCLHLHYLCFFCFMLICQLAIGGQKGGGFCHHRIEVSFTSIILSTVICSKRIYSFSFIFIFLNGRISQLY